MKFCCVLVICALAACIFLLLYALSVKSAVREISSELEEKLNTDTNTQNFVSSCNKSVRRLAARINKQLAALRRERLRLCNGDAELKTAVTNISHDLRTPLTAICGYLDILSRDAELPERATHYLKIMKERADTMRSMTEELLNYSVISDAADALRPEAVVINDVLEQSLTGFYGVFSEHGILPVITIPAKKTICLADKAAIRRIFDNILNNAAKYSDGDLSVALTADGTIRFENSAKNLTHVKTERLFDRFYTVNTARDGTGLGLSIAKTLTEKSGGSITAEYSTGRLTVCVKFPKAKCRDKNNKD